MEFDLNNLDKSIFTFEWKKFQENKCYPIGPDDFKIDIQYRDENNNLKKEKILMSDTRKPEFSLKKDLRQNFQVRNLFLLDILQAILHFSLYK